MLTIKQFKVKKSDISQLRPFSLNKRSIVDANFIPVENHCRKLR